MEVRKGKQGIDYRMNTLEGHHKFKEQEPLQIAIKLPATWQGDIPDRGESKFVM